MEEEGVTAQQSVHDEDISTIGVMIGIPTTQF
jgi:hypothetical protein